MTQHHGAVASFDRIVVIFNPHSTVWGSRTRHTPLTSSDLRLPAVGHDRHVSLRLVYLIFQQVL